MVDMKTRTKFSPAQAVGKAIAQRRVACGLTQESIAEQLNIGLEAVSRIERGLVSPNVDRLFELAEIFDCPVADLVSRPSKRPADQAQRLTGLLARLNESDRAMIVEMLERLASRLSKN